MSAQSNKLKIQGVVLLALLLITVWRLINTISTNQPNQFPQKEK